MKIGIITHHYINNFGAFLQTYALARTLTQLYPDAQVQVIDYVNLPHALINTLGWFRFYGDRETPSAWLRKIRLPAIFNEARHKYLPLTKRVHSAEQVNAMNFDVIIVGSDEVWNYADKKSVDLIKFGHGLNCKNIMGYALSAGQAAKTPAPDFVKEGVKRFSHLSARDTLTYELIKGLGGSVQRVIDPTMLTDVAWEKVQVKKPYILFYYCQNMPKATLEAVKRFAAEKGLAVYGAGECDKMYDSVTVNLTPFQWTGMFREAEYVVTGTFHGVIFAILNHKQFVCYMTNPSRIEKVNSLLDEFGLTERRLEPQTDIAALLCKKIDYANVQDLIDEKAELSRQYLRESIGEQNE